MDGTEQTERSFRCPACGHEFGSKWEPDGETFCPLCGINLICRCEPQASKDRDGKYLVAPWVELLQSARVVGQPRPKAIPTNFPTKVVYGGLEFEKVKTVAWSERAVIKNCVANEACCHDLVFEGNPIGLNWVAAKTRLMSPRACLRVWFGDDKVFECDAANDIAGGPRPLSVELLVLCGTFLRVRFAVRCVTNISAKA